MNLRQRILPPGCLIATVFAVASTALYAEQIQISKPAVGIASPIKVEENLPETDSKRLDFGTREIARPMVPQQQTIIRIQPRQENDGDDRFSPRGPKRLTDPPRRGSDTVNARNPFAARDAESTPPWSSEPHGFNRTDSQQALSPVMQLDWDARDSATSQRGTTQSRPATGRDADRKRTGRDEYGAQNETFDPSPFRDLFAARPKEKPSRALVERRAAFEHLLNPAAGMAGRPPGSLEPIAALGTPKSAPSIAIPIPGVAKLDSRPTDPMQAFNVQHNRLRGPAMEDVNKKYSTPATVFPSTTLNSRSQTPLNRQPTTRELPTRKF